MKTKETLKCKSCGSIQLESLGSRCQYPTARGCCGGEMFDEKSTRESALTYFNSLPRFDQQMLTDRYFNKRHRQSLTGREIEEIWKNEVQVKELSNAYHNVEYLKPNQKQFKQFNPELFKAYIDKFSDEDKLKARRILQSTISIELLIDDELKRLKE